MAAVIDKDLSLSGELAYDSEKNQQVVILYTWENVFAEPLLIGYFIGQVPYGYKKYYEEGVRILELLKNAYSLYSKQNNNDKRKMLKYVLSNCTINNKKVSYDYNLPFSYFINFASCNKKLPRLDSNQQPTG